MKTIAVVCEKGGTGKSVIAAELYESYVRQGLRTSLYSLDGQYSDSPRSKKVDDAEVAVVDTPGVLTDNLTDIVKGADVVVVPVRPLRTTSSRSRGRCPSWRRTRRPLS